MRATPIDVLEGRAQWCVVEGDCLDVLPTIERVDHVITDPPYEAQAHTKQRRIKSSACRGTKWSETGGVLVVEPLSFEPITEMDRSLVSAEIVRVTQRWALVFCQVEAAMTWRDAMSADTFSYRRTCVWIKPDAMPQLTGDRPGRGRLLGRPGH